MKNLLSLAGFLLAAAVLFSCAGAPEMIGAEKPAEGAESAEAPLTKVVWKPGTEVSMYVDGTVDKTITRNYDQLGNLLTVTEIDGKGNLLYRREYTWMNGLLESVLVSDKVGPVSLTLYESDGMGRIVEEIGQDSSGTVLSRLRFTYDDDQLTETVAMDRAGNINLVSQYHYQDGVVVRLEYRTAGGDLEATFRRTLENGRKTGEQTVLPDGTVETERTFEYSGDLIVRESHSAQGLPTKSVLFDHDDQGNIVREVWSNRSGREYEIVEREWLRFEIAR